MERPMTTGIHIVRDIFCLKCKTQVGWKYVSSILFPALPAFTFVPLTIGQDKAYNEQQAYKEGKFILERAMIQDVQ